MWERLPIQRKGLTGSPYSCILPRVAYTRYPDVRICKWKYVPSSVRKWAFKLWKDEFHCMRCPLAANDLFAWIPEVGTLASRRGHWIGKSKSREINYIVCNYVVPSHRSKGVAQHLIESLCHEVCLAHGDRQVFFFELEKVPSSLATATPFQRVRYRWFPCASPAVWERMHRSDLKQKLTSELGFHPRTYAGYVGYTWNEEWVILDAHNDVIVCSTYDALSSFPAEEGGVYARIPSELGTVSVFAQNMYFAPEPTDVYLLG
jgi:hypothetical protein